MIELVHAPRVAARISPPTPAAPKSNDAAPAKDPYLSQRIDYRLANSPAELRDVWDMVTTYLIALGDDVQTKEVKLYVAFKRIKNFVCLEIYPTARTVAAYVKLNPDTVALEPGFTRDVRKIGHFGTGDLEIVMRTADDVAKAQILFQRAYEQN